MWRLRVLARHCELARSGAGLLASFLPDVMRVRVTLKSSTMSCPRSPSTRAFSVRFARAWGLFVLGSAVGCGAGQSSATLLRSASGSPEESVEDSGAATPTGSLPPGLSSEWAQETASPRRATDEPLRLPGCSAYEAPLARAAAVVARARAARQQTIEVSDVVVMLRAFGSPHVWPRVWTLETDALTPELLQERWSSWLSPVARTGERRCGVARALGPAGREVIAAILVDSAADLAPLPTRVRAGQWLRLEARLLAPASAGRVVLLGPWGAPRTVPSRLSSDTLRSSFNLDRPGLWRVQVLLAGAFGPRPALEAWVFVDRDPDLSAAFQRAPGEASVAGSGPGASAAELSAALFAMVATARRSEGLVVLRREARLDELAQAHAEAMWRAERTAHDTGQGPPLERVSRAGVPALRVGENVAHSSSLSRAHRALWDSPSHRGNLVDPGFDAVGIGVFAAGENELWVCELFVDYAADVMAVALESIIPGVLRVEPSRLALSSALFDTRSTDEVRRRGRARDGEALVSTASSRSTRRDDPGNGDETKE